MRAEETSKPPLAPGSLLAEIGYRSFFFLAFHNEFPKILSYRCKKKFFIRKKQGHFAKNKGVSAC